MRVLTLHAAFCCATLSAALPCLATSTNFAARAQRAYEAALEDQRRNPTNATIAVAVAQTAYEWAEFAVRDEQREEIANQGIAACRSAILAQKTNAAAHYWLGMNLGQLARTKWLGAIPMVKDMEKTFFKARDLDPKVDYAGPDRSLGLLYREAPGWPTSVGDKKKARIHLERAAKITPEFPENQLGLAESYDRWGDRKAFERQLPKVEQSMAEGRKIYMGEDWEAEWQDWEERLRALKAKR